MQTARNMRNFYTFSDSPIKMQFTGYFYQKLSRSNFSYLLWHSVELIEECAFYYFPQNFLFTLIEILKSRMPQFMTYCLLFEYHSNLAIHLQIATYNCHVSSST